MAVLSRTKRRQDVQTLPGTKRRQEVPTLPRTKRRQDVPYLVQSAGRMCHTSHKAQAGCALPDTKRRQDVPYLAQSAGRICLTSHKAQPAWQDVTRLRYNHDLATVEGHRHVCLPTHVKQGCVGHNVRGVNNARARLLCVNKSLI